MTTTTKVFLAISVVCLVAGLAFFTGLVSVHSLKPLYVVLPIGATFFGMFLISKMLEKEQALYEKEHHSALSTPATRGAREPKA